MNCAPTRRNLCWTRATQQTLVVPLDGADQYPASDFVLMGRET